MPEKTVELLRALFKRDYESAEEYCVPDHQIYASWRTLMAQCGYTKEEVEELWKALQLDAL